MEVVKIIIYGIGIMIVIYFIIVFLDVKQECKTGSDFLTALESNTTLIVLILIYLIWLFSKLSDISF